MRYLNRVVLLLVLLVCRQATADAPPNLRQIAQQVGLDQHLDRQVPLDLKFRDEAGREVQLREYFRGKPVVLNLVYFRCPMLCTQVLNGFLKSSQALPLQMGTDYEVISVSIDPDETPEMAAAKKQRYAGSYRRPGAEEGWHFLTGEQVAIDRLARTVGYRYHYDAKSGQYAHPSGIIVLTPDGRISRYFYGIEYHPTDLRLGLVESSQGRIGTLADQVLLLCFHYDPATGKYGLVISGVLRLAGLLTVAVLGSFLFVMFRREARRSADATRAAEPRALVPENLAQQEPAP
ncbi:MAG: SCO family protein [Pirellulaceae bacterium]